MEQVAPQLEVQRDSEESLAQRDEARHMEDGAGIQMLNLQPIEEKKPPHERMQGKTESTLIERSKDNHLIPLRIWRAADIFQSPPGLRLARKKALLLQDGHTGCAPKEGGGSHQSGLRRTSGTG